MRTSLVLAAVLLTSGVAFADATAGPGQCIEVDNNGCSGCGHELCNPPAPDLAAPRDLSVPAIHDLSSPPDARRERRRQRNSAHGRGLVLLSGVSALAVLGLRRRYKTMSPTPAEKAFAASATRKDS